MFHVPSFPVLARAAPHPALPLQIVLNETKQTAHRAPAARRSTGPWEAAAGEEPLGSRRRGGPGAPPCRAGPALGLGRGRAVHLPHTSPPRPPTREVIITVCRGLMSHLRHRLTRREKGGESPTRILGPCPRVTLFSKLPFNLQPEAGRSGEEGTGIARDSDYNGVKQRTQPCGMGRSVNEGLESTAGDRACSVRQSGLQIRRERSHGRTRARS